MKRLQLKFQALAKRLNSLLSSLKNVAAEMGFPVVGLYPFLSECTAAHALMLTRNTLCFFSPGAIGMNNRGAMGGTSVPAGPPPATGPGPMIPDGAMGMVMSSKNQMS